MIDPSSEPYDVVILGGGFAGVYAAKALGKRLRRAKRRFSVAIVAEENHMVFQPMLPEVAGAALSPRHVVNPIRSLCREAEVFKAKATRIDLESRSVTVAAGDFVASMDLRFRHLALCLGAKIDVSRIPGMQEHSLIMQNVGDAMRLRAHFIGRFEEANLSRDADARRRLLTFVVVGGGYSGVETAGQLLDLGMAIHRRYKNIGREDFRLVLVHSRDHLLPTLHRDLGRYTADKLRERGLELVLERRAKAVTANKIYLDDGQAIETNTVVCTVGNAPHPLVLGLEGIHGVELERGRIKTGADMATPALDWLWAAGDCAAIPQEDGGYCPPTAQFAMRQGTLLGKNIAQRLSGAPTRPFTFKAIGELAAIGHMTAVAELKGMRFSGFIAWWMWRTVYLSKLPGLERKIRVMVDWTLELFFRRDINLLNPRYTSDVAKTYLEPGDKLFNRGDPAFSFYIVQSGAIELREEGRAVATIRANQHFGERALLSGDAYLFEAVAIEPTTLVTVGSGVFRQVVEADATFAANLKQSARSYLTTAELDALLRRLPDSLLDRPVAERMTSPPIFVKQTDHLDRVMEILRQAPMNALPVVDDADAPVGVLSKEAFLLRYQTTDLRGNDQVATLDLTALPIVKADRPVREAMSALARGNASKAMVIDGEGRLVGVLALIDILAAEEAEA